MRGLVTYSGSNAAVVGMTRPAGKELGRQIGTVNAVAPDVVRGGGLDAVTGEVRAEQLSIRLRRLEIAEVAAFLARNRASNATGRVTGVKRGDGRVTT